MASRGRRARPQHQHPLRCQSPSRSSLGSDISLGVRHRHQHVSSQNSIITDCDDAHLIFLSLDSTSPALARRLSLQPALPGSPLPRTPQSTWGTSLRADRLSPTAKSKRPPGASRMSWRNLGCQASKLDFHYYIYNCYHTFSVL